MKNVPFVFEKRENFLQNGILNFAVRFSHLSEICCWKVKNYGDKKLTFLKWRNALQAVQSSFILFNQHQSFYLGKSITACFLETNSG